MINNKEKIIEIISEIRKMSIEEIKEVIKELDKEEQEWIPGYGEEYCYYDKDTEEVEKTYFFNTYIDNTRLRNKVIFKTEQEAQRYADYQKAKREYSYDFSKEEWENDDIGKHYLYYNYDSEELKTSYYFECRDTEQIYFKTKEQAQEFIDKYEKEILEFEFGIKE